MGKVMVLVEHRKGEIREITYEMLKKAQELDKEVEAVLIGEDLSELKQKVRPYCSKLITVKVEGLNEFNSEPYQQILSQLLTQRKPKILIIGHSSQGMDLAPSLGVALGCGVITDVVDFGFQNGEVWAIRQVYGGKLSAKVKASSETVILTVRSGSFDPQGLLVLEGEEEEEVSFPLAPFPYKRFLGFLEAPKAEVDITQADVIVSVGRGIGGPENIPLADELAKALGGVLACSRPVVDKGWLPKERQVGTSGKTVKPKVYIALGISGAFQHVAGMKGAQMIIAVNKDPKAPIFNVAHYGIVGDALQVIPNLLNKLKERKK